jgi:hypothetical protein
MSSSVAATSSRSKQSEQLAALYKLTCFALLGELEQKLDLPPPPPTLACSAENIKALWSDVEACEALMKERLACKTTPQEAIA